MFERKISASLDLGSSSIKGITLKNGKIEKVEIESIPHGAMLSGNIEDPMAVTDSLKKIAEKLDLKNKNIILSIPVQNFVIKFLEVIEADEESQKSLIEHELEDIIPNFEAENFVTEYSILGKEEGNDKVMAITIQKDKIKELIEILTSLKIRPLKIIPDIISQFNLLQNIKDEILKEGEENILILDIGAEATKIFIEKNGKIIVQKVAPIGGNDFTDIIERNIGLNYEEAEKYKENLELHDEKEIMDEDEDEDDIYEENEIQEEIANLIEDLNVQIQMAIDYFKLQEGEMGVEKILVSGGGSKLKGLGKILEQKMVIELIEFPIQNFFVSNIDIKEKVNGNEKSFVNMIGNLIDEVEL